MTATGHEAGPLAHLRVLDLSRATRGLLHRGAVRSRRRRAPGRTARHRRHHADDPGRDGGVPPRQARDDARPEARRCARDPAPPDRAGRRGGGVGPARRTHGAGHRPRHPRRRPARPGVVHDLRLRRGQPVRQAAGARHHVPRLLGPHGPDGGRHRPAHARLRARRALRLAHRGRRDPRRHHRTRPHRHRRVRRHRDRRQRDLGARRSGRAGCRRPARRLGRGGIAAHVPRRRREAGRRSPPPSRARGPRSARRSIVPTSPVR